MNRFRLTIQRAAILTGLFIALWRVVVFVLGTDSLSLPFLARQFDWIGIGTMTLVDNIGWGIFFLIGFCWTIFLVEKTARGIEARLRVPARSARPAIVIAGEHNSDRKGGWDPFDPASPAYSTAPSLVLFAILVTIAISSAVIWLVLGIREPLSNQFILYILTRVITGSVVLAIVALASAFAHGKKVRQTLAMLTAYSLFFLLIHFLAHLKFGPSDETADELPAGGGSDSIQASSVKVTKVIRKKYVINPYSSILFAAPPPLDQVDTKLTEETANRYQVGQGTGATGEGDGDGSGFGSGTGKGKASFVRLRHGDRGWDKNYGLDGDRNMLKQYHLRTKQKVSEETEWIEAAIAPKKAPFLLYVSGIASLPLTSQEKKYLRDYIIDQHGMILGDNHGGQAFHNSFVAMMNEITGVTPVQIPRDDYIHQKPYALPELPIVVAHGGVTPLGWKIDGRWAVYYHPGALSDAWRSDRAGIRPVIAELCEQLGVNLMYYSMRERDKWNKSRKP